MVPARGVPTRVVPTRVVPTRGVPTRGPPTRGAVTRTSLMRVTGWEGARADAALRELIRCGACMVDDGDAIAGERVYWLPCVSEGAA